MTHPPILFEDAEALVIDKPGGLPIERPRNLDVVMEPEFIRMKRHILGLLHDDMEEVH